MRISSAHRADCVNITWFDLILTIARKGCRLIRATHEEDAQNRNKLWKALVEKHGFARSGRRENFSKEVKKHERRIPIRS